MAGDKILIDISAIISDSCSENAKISRMAGNEFVVIFKGKDPQKYMQLAETIKDNIAAQDFSWQENKLQLTSSIGLIAINKYTENIVDLVRNAVMACKTAKENGGNRVNDFRQDTELQTRREKLLGWIDKLNCVLSSDRLVLRGQLIKPVSHEEDSPHYEILIALKEEDGTLVSPVEFIEAAECYNRMQKVDRWVVENVFQWLQKLRDAGSDLPSVSINLSGNSINDDQLMDFLLEQFAKYKVPTQKVCFEVTETATIANIAAAADFIREIKKIGCKFSLDDFGSGNASYQYLKHLPIDFLKIDGTFIQNIVNSPDDYAMVKSINEIAHFMGKLTIAEPD